MTQYYYVSVFETMYGFITVNEHQEGVRSGSSPSLYYSNLFYSDFILKKLLFMDLQ